MGTSHAHDGTEIGRYRWESSRPASLVAVGITYAAAVVAVVLVMGTGAAFHTSAPYSLLLCGLWADLAATALVFLASAVLDNSSVYDPYWSAVPPVIYLVWIVVAAHGAVAISLRSVLILVLSWAWGIRLTLNWAFRWRGLRDEDWRYLEFRRTAGRAYWPVSFLAVHLFPTLSVFAGSLPVYFALTSSSTDFGLLGALAVVVTGGAILIEAAADAELRRFRKSTSRGVIRSGLWKYSRHPNYLGEMLFWVGMLLFGLSSGAPWWSAIGVLVMIGIFFGYSIPRMERRLLESRPEYAEVRKHVSLIVPLPRR